MATGLQFYPSFGIKLRSSLEKLGDQLVQSNQVAGGNVLKGQNLPTPSFFWGRSKVLPDFVHFLVNNSVGGKTMPTVWGHCLSLLPAFTCFGSQQVKQTNKQKAVV